LKKNDKKFQTGGKKEKNEEKLKKKMQKDVLYNTHDTQTFFNVKIGNFRMGEISGLKMRVNEMLK
jgi:hypothetical protein